MSVLIYRTRLTKNIKRFGKFGVDIKNRLYKKGVNIDIVHDAKKEICLDQIQAHETTVIIAHGNDDIIYHRLHRTICKTQPLISKTQLYQENTKLVSAFRGKKVIAIACRTARVLGEYACRKAGCLAYLGFYNQIHFDKRDGFPEKDVSPEYYQFILEYYQAVFADVLEKAIEDHWSFLKLATIMKIELQRRIMPAIQADTSIKSPYYKKFVFGQAYLAVINVADNIKIFGNEYERVE